MRPATPGVYLPEMSAAIPSGTGIMEKLYKIEHVDIIAVFDDQSEPLVHLERPKSSQLLELLNRANLHRGTVTHLWLKNEPIAPAALARLNWFLHTPGYTKGFRGWRIALQEQDGGLILWKSAAAWEELKQIIKA